MVAVDSLTYELMLLFYLYIFRIWTQPRQNVEQSFSIDCIQSFSMNKTNLQTVTSYFMSSWFMSQNELQKFVFFFEGGGVIFYGFYHGFHHDDSP